MFTEKLKEMKKKKQHQNGDDDGVCTSCTKYCNNQL